MSVLLLTADLNCSSQVSGVAARLGVVLGTVMNPDQLVARASEISPGMVILDLNTPLLDCQQLVPQLKSLSSPSTIIAFGPHVHEARLAAAREAGCDRVMARGQFYAQVEQILAAAQSK